MNSRAGAFAISDDATAVTDLSEKALLKVLLALMKKPLANFMIAMKRAFTVISIAVRAMKRLPKI